jgi:hypothetical protein
MTGTPRGAPSRNSDAHLGLQRMTEPGKERTIEERVGEAREGLTLLADYL